MKTVSSDDYLVVKNDGSGDVTEIEKDTTTTTISNSVTDLFHELAECVRDIEIKTKYEEFKFIIFGTTALAAGNLEAYLSKQQGTPEIATEPKITEPPKSWSQRLVQW